MRRTLMSVFCGLLLAVLNGCGSEKPPLPKGPTGPVPAEVEGGPDAGLSKAKN